FLVGSVVGLAAGVVARLVGADQVADGVWAAVAVAGLVPTGVGVVRGIIRRQPGVDVIAVLALAGALAIGEFAAAAVITVMLATGQLLEARAGFRAERDLRRLLARAPAVAHRRDGGTVVDVAVAEIEPGDTLVVKAGETVPVDGRLSDGSAVLDVSALTGEPMPETVAELGMCRSGAINAGGAFEVRVVARASESTYAGIVRLVESARADTAPFVRLADRFALVFIPVALLVAALGWVLSGSFERAVAVLVVSTPCPLILAVPVAITSGLSRAARRGVIVKGGGVLEQLAHGEVLVFDKTGTVTLGRPVLVDVAVAEGSKPDELLGLAASVEQASPHVLASSIVAAAVSGGVDLHWPRDAHEVVGQGSVGTVGEHRVRVGRLEWLAPHGPPTWARTLRRRVATDGVMTVYVEVDGTLVGALVLEDPLRPDASRTLRSLRRSGFRRLVMASGDRAAAVEAVGAAVGADEVLAERTPEEKAAAVRIERESGVTVMVGDGVNDAPALAVADVGVALGARGATASSDTADVVLTVDRLDRLADVVHIARRSHRVAIESVLVGMGLAAVAMVAAAAGLLPPLAGAIVQELIDVLAIANALRALTPGRERLERLLGADADLSRRFQAEHDALASGIRKIRPLADDVDRVPPTDALARLVDLRTFLEGQLLPHELAEDRDLYPAIALVLGGQDPTAPMSRMHIEIAHLIGLFGRLVDDLAPSGPDLDDARELRRVLYSLDAVMRLHMAQEEQEYLSLADALPDAETGRRARS
ncbi:MAG: heavy metal translocating P-type ATPase, partial [Acidimicrobiales bacterium]